MNRIIIVLFATVSIFSGLKKINGQGIVGFSDFNKHFYAFDHGTIRQLEYQEIISFSSGENSIAYVNGGGNLYVYYNHISHEIASGSANYQVTNNLLSYQLGNQLYVFEDGKNTLLSKFVGSYKVSDSIVAFIDTEKYYFQVYYNGTIYTIQDGLVAASPESFTLGKNLLAYIDYRQNLRVFYHGIQYELLKTNSQIEMQAGRNILAYIDPQTDYLHIFFKGEQIEIENFKPESMQAGNEKLAYIDYMGNLKLWDTGNVYEVCTFTPQKYELIDDLLLYQIQGQFYLFIDGNSYLIENYIPSAYSAKGKNFAYVNQNGYLVSMNRGEKEVLSYEVVNKFEVLSDLIVYNTGLNSTIIYYQGKKYQK